MAGVTQGRRAGSDGAVGQAGGGDAPSLGETAGDLAENVASVASDLAGAAREQGRTLLDAARGQATTFADQRKDNAAQAISDIASSLRSSGDGFEEKQSLHAFVGTAADGLDQLASSLRDRSVVELYGEVEDFARRQPVAVGAAAVIAGFVIARFIKSSADDLAVQSAQNRRETAAASRATSVRGRTRDA